MAARNNKLILLSAISGLVLFGLFSAGVGLLVGYKQIWPFAQIQETVRIVKSLASDGEVIAAGRRHRAPAGASRDPATLHDAAKSVGQGYYALMGWDNERDAYSVHLYDAAAQHLHTWPIDEMTISDAAQHRQNAPHAMEVLKDGSVLVSFDWLGLMARLDACGTAIWSRDGFFHHAFSPAADGGIWTWYGDHTGYGQIQDILKFDPVTGADMTRLSFNNDVIMRSPDSALYFSMFTDFDFVPNTVFSLDKERPEDIFHPNDVEELFPELAPAFPQFEAGDLMLSIRQLNMVIVIAPTGEIKWSQQGPWMGQHDPDFEPDGRISVYNNGVDRPRSSIITIDPQTRALENPIAAFSGPFLSRFRGKHQRLPNGNRLITIPEQGQAIEVAPDGTLVMEFNNVVPERPDLNDDLVNAKWLPADFFETLPTCSG